MRLLCLMADTYRYDHLGAAGDLRGLTPELDALAKRAFFFESAYHSSFPTVPNREDCFTGNYSFPFRGWGPLPEAAVPAAEILSDAGYVTQLVTDTPHLLGSGHGYHRGFLGYHWNRGNECDIYLTRCNHEMPSVMPASKTRNHPLLYGHPLVDWHHWINAEAVGEQESFAATTATLVCKWLEDNYKVEDFFLWVDCFECHEPWCPPDYYVERFDPKGAGLHAEYPNYHYADVYSKAELRNMRARYAGEVALQSKWLGHILRKLEDVGIYDDTLIVFTSDHGTYLGERNRTGKFMIDRDDGHFLPWPQYDENNRVPLIMKLPRQTKGKRLRGLVQSVDLLPTLLDLAGVDPGLPFHGVSLAPNLTGGSRAWPRKAAYSTFSLQDKLPNFWTTVTTNQWSLNVGGDAADKPELFDRKADPGQTRNLYRKHVDTADRLIRDYAKWLRSVGTEESKVALIEDKLSG